MYVYFMQKNIFPHQSQVSLSASGMLFPYFFLPILRTDKSPNWKNNSDQTLPDTGVSRHHGGLIEGHTETPRCITALSYSGA